MLVKLDGFHYVNSRFIFDMRLVKVDESNFEIQILIDHNSKNIPDSMTMKFTSMDMAEFALDHLLRQINGG